MSGVGRAAFDALELAKRLANQGQRGFTPAELHSLAYVACVLAVYDGRAPHWWGYRFTATTTGAPFALELTRTVERLTARECLRHADVISLTDAGERELAELRTFPMNIRRARYLAGACDAAMALPLPSITEAVSYEPQLRSSVNLQVVQQLLDDTGLQLIEPHLAELRVALDDQPDGDLMVPAVIWLTYLAEAAGLLHAPETTEAA